MHAFYFSTLLLGLASLGLGKPTPSINAPPTVARAVGDTTTVTQGNGHVWQFTLTIQAGSDSPYEDEDLEDTVDAFSNEVAHAAANDDYVEGSYSWSGGKLSLSLSTNTEDGVTIGSVSSRA